jgi:hypothetical protein
LVEAEPDHVIPLFVETSREAVQIVSDREFRDTVAVGRVGAVGGRVGVLAPVTRRTCATSGRVITVVATAAARRDRNGYDCFIGVSSGEKGQ